MTQSAQTFFQWSDLVRVEPTDPIAPADDGIDGADAYWTDALAQALEFASRGWRILPLYGIRQGNCTCNGRDKCVKNAGKHPHFSVHNGLKGADNRAETINDRWFGKFKNLNIGIRTGEQHDGPCLLVIDIDIKVDPLTGKSALQMLAQLEAELGRLPRTHVVETGSGGLHIYVSYPKGLLVKSSQGKLGHGIDTKGENSYVVAPPSRHKSGGTYKVIRFDAGAPPMIPPAWLQRLKELGMVSNKSGLPTKLEAAERAQRDAERAAQQTADHADPAGDESGDDAVCQMPQLPEGTVFDKSNGRTMAAFFRAEMSGSGHTNDTLIGLVCSLKNNPANAGKTARDFYGLFKLHWENNKQHMSAPEWEPWWNRFEQAFEEWAKPQQGPHWQAAAAVGESGGVEAAMRAKNPAKALLASIYHALQKIKGTETDIWLSCDSRSDILKSLGFDLDRYQVNRLQQELRRDGVIQIQGQAVKGGWWAQRVKTLTAVVEETLGKARRTVKFLLTPKQLLTLVGMKEQQNTICVLPPPADADQTLFSVLIHPDDLTHAARFLPPDVWRLAS